MSRLPLLVQSFLDVSQLALQTGPLEHRISVALIRVPQGNLDTLIQNEAHHGFVDLSSPISAAKSGLQSLRSLLQDIDDLRRHKLKRVLESYRKPELEKNLCEAIAACQFKLASIHSIVHQRWLQGLEDTVQRLVEATLTSNISAASIPASQIGHSHQSSTSIWERKCTTRDDRGEVARFSLPSANSPGCRSGMCSCSCHKTTQLKRKSQTIFSGFSWEAVLATCRCPTRPMSWTIFAFEKHINVCFTILYERGFSLTFSRRYDTLSLEHHRASLCCLYVERDWWGLGKPSQS